MNEIEEKKLKFLLNFLDAKQKLQKNFSVRNCISFCVWYFALEKVKKEISNLEYQQFLEENEN